MHLNLLASGGGGGGGAIASGSPDTGVGGAPSFVDSVLVSFGGLALLGAAVAMSHAIRRRRVLVAGRWHGGHE